MSSSGHARRWNSSPLTRWTWSLAALAVLGSGGWAANRQMSRQEANNLVEEALHREIYSQNDKRSALVAEVLSQYPEFAPARWQAGFVHYQNRWIPAVDVSQNNDLTQRLLPYERLRAKTAATLEGQLSLAEWCARNDLPEQERAHLHAVLRLVPEHADARRRLGFQRVNGLWVESSVLWQGLQDASATQAALRTWLPHMEDFEKGYALKNEAKRAAAINKLLAIDDPEAIAALEWLAGRGEEQGQYAVATLAGLPYYEATLALARIGVFADSPVTRNRAAEALRDRNYDGFVPQLLAEMQAPAESRIFSALANGRIYYRHVFLREGQTENQWVVLDTIYRRQFVNLGVGLAALPSPQNDAQTFRRMQADMNQTISDRETLRALYNTWVAENNQRLCEVLRAATRQQLPNDDVAWWNWWNEQNGVVQTGDKRQQVAYDREVKTYEKEILSFQSPEAEPQRRCECFVAGTPVWTARGQKPIEQVQVGDLVLAQDLRSGQLTYKPVTDISQRPPERLFQMRAESDVLQASGGHPLWVNGQGWMLARDMESGMVLHAIDRGVLVTDVESAEAQATYNLVVDGFHTYFVGKAGILCHDNTPRRPTNAKVPGLLLSALQK